MFLVFLYAGFFYPSEVVRTSYSKCFFFLIYGPFIFQMLQTMQFHFLKYILYSFKYSNKIERDIPNIAQKKEEEKKESSEAFNPATKGHFHDPL